MLAVTLVHITPCWQELICGAASHCYEKNVGLKAMQRIIESGHTSILEHAHATFDIEADLGVLGQITRHRHLSFTVKSTRGADFNNFHIPNEIMENEQALLIYLNAMKTSFEAKGELQALGISLEHAAFSLPKATLTKFRVTGNFRAWYNYLPLRVCKRAMEEHGYIAWEIQKLLAEAAPEIFNRNFLDCVNCTEGKCSFV